MTLSEEYQKKVIEAFEEADYCEIFGLDFSTDAAEWTKAHENVLQKFVDANEGRIDDAIQQLLNTLKWRKEYQPLKAKTETFDEELTKLGVVTKSPDGKIVTWNLYGAVKNPAAIFKDTENFVRWRVGLHEHALAALDFSDDKLSRMDQVHDYMNVSFWRLDPNIKKSSSKIIELFQSYYPETLNAKYFVNVPYVMMWVFKLVRAITASATTAKFHVIANGDQLASELGEWVPKTYGGKAESLQTIAVGGPKARSVSSEEVANAEDTKKDEHEAPAAAAEGAATEGADNSAPAEGAAAAGAAAAAAEPADQEKAANGAAFASAEETNEAAVPTETAAKPVNEETLASEVSADVIKDDSAAADAADAVAAASSEAKEEAAAVTGEETKA